VSAGSLDADEARHRLYGIMKGDDPFESKAREALELGTAYLGVETGFVTRIEPEIDYWETVVSTDGAGGMVPEGMRTDLSGTYCRHTLERDSPLALHDVPNQSFDPGTDGFDCYHGTTLTVGGEPYGTVCFVSRTARDRPFTEAETMFAELVSRLLEHELEHERQQERLARQTSLVNVLDRVLRHNIRNKMTVVRANARLHGERHGGCTECEKIVDAANELIDMSETARQIGKSINAEFERRPLDIGDLLREVGERAGEAYPDATVDVDVPDGLVFPALPSLETAVWELVENAGRYAGPGPRIRIAGRDRDDCVEIEVADDGPGLPAAERDVLQTGTETQLAHGSGLGLWSAHWVATSHGGTMDIDTDDGTRVTLTLPRPGPGGEREPRISRAEDRYEAAFENRAVGMALLDDESHITEVNDRTATLLDRSESAVVGRPIAEVLTSVTGPLATSRAAAGEGRCTVDTAEGPRELRYTVTPETAPGQRLVVFGEPC
jgi:nitrogen-specific signal transduction histidine kinase